MESQKITITKGLTLPIAGHPDQTVIDSAQTSRVAVLGTDFVGLKPHMTVAVGDYVRMGDSLFFDKKNTAVQYTAPGSGKITAINRGERRKLLSIVIQLDNAADEPTFTAYSEHDLSSLDRKSVTGLLLTSGLWTSIRSRPYSKVADPERSPDAIFVTAMDSNPLAPAIVKIVENKEKELAWGLTVLSRLTDGKVLVCKAPEDSVPCPPLDSLSVVSFAGPHPAGLPGTHIHYLEPVGRNRQAWYLNVQDVAAIGHLFTTGKLDVERIISLAGPSVKNPRLIKTRLGASLEDLTKDELNDGENRVISGSVFSGFNAHEETAFLGRYHQQVTALPEGRKRKFLGWLNSGVNVYSVKNLVLSRLFPGKQFNFTTASHGDRRAIVPVGAYEKIMPLDIMATHLLKALASDDIDEAEKLGCLELDEEDLALCTFVCPSKINHGEELRRNLTLIEKEES